MKAITTGVAALLLTLTQGPAMAQTAGNEVAELRQMLDELRSDYEQRIAALEERLTAAERAASGAKRDAQDAIDAAEDAAMQQSSAASAPNTFNPGIGVILGAGYASVDDGWDAIPGFMPGGEIGTGETGFGLGEAELNLSASVDNRFYGNLTLGVHDHDGEVETEIEEAWVQTTGLPAAVTVTGGRFFSSAGYLNGFHFHADDFVDRPLPYQAFIGGRYLVDGLRAAWVAPTTLFLEMGGELNWGGAFPATANEEDSPGAWTLFAKAGGDVGTDHSWQVGIAHVSADVLDRSAAVEHDDEPVDAETFTGDSDLTVLDFVWKWAPGGNATLRNWKLQGEYFRRRENGLYAGLPYDGDQDGWYLQGIWQFVQHWRVGLRHDTVHADNGASLANTLLASPGRHAYRNTLMVDWSPSEFSRLRLQYIDDHVLPEGDGQWYLQYIMSLGAHGAHQFEEAPRCCASCLLLLSFWRRSPRRRSRSSPANPNGARW